MLFLSSQRAINPSLLSLPISIMSNRVYFGQYSLLCNQIPIKQNIELIKN